MAAHADPQPAVELRGVAKHFGATVALHALDLDIRKGEFFSLLGPSGCGKTTTLNLIGGFESASAGEVLIDGQAVRDVPPFRRPVNTVFQNYALFPHMSVADNVGFGLRMKHGRRPSGSRPWPRCCAWCRCRATRTGGRRSSAAASASAWRWRARWSTGRRCCCWTSRWVRWT
jgi:ABC-type sugar transport system ATPase subunit